MTSDYKDIFHGTAWYYARYREGYPQEFFDLIRQKFDLSAGDRVLDLGCGTGQISISLSTFAKEVVAMDPEPEMIEEGKNQAEIHKVKNIVWLEGGSADLPDMKASLGSFKLVTMGTSFHWMDREKTLDELYEIITDGGGVVIVGNTSIWTRVPNNWQTAAREVIKKWLGEERRAGSGVYEPVPRRHEEFIEESRFGRIETWQHHWVRSSTLDEVVGNLYSTSMANPFVLGDKKDAFEKDLREVLLHINPDGVFISEGDLEAILAWK